MEECIRAFLGGGVQLTSRTFLRVPRVRRLEYLVAFLKGYRKNEFDESLALKAIQQQIHYFEVEKAKALGRQRPRTRRGTSTLQECVKLASNLGLVDRSRHLTAEAAQVIDSHHRRSFLLERIWQTYPRFRQVMLTARNAERLNLPFYARGDSFRQEAGPLYSFEFDLLTFEAIRDLATQLELVNWYPSEQRRQVVYPVVSIAILSEMISLTGLLVDHESFAQQCRHQTALDLDLLSVRDGHYERPANTDLDPQDYTVLQSGLDKVFIRDHHVSAEDFEQVLWQEYL